MSAPRKIVGAVAALLVTVGLGGCSSTVDGTSAAPDTSSPGILDPGPYRTTPQDPFSTAGSEDQGRIIEGRRMAEFVVLPTEVDPVFTRASLAPGVVFKNGLDTKVFLSGQAPRIADEENLITSFVSTRLGATDREIFTIAVLRFPDSAAAVRAADRMSADTKVGGDKLPPSLDAPIPGRPDIRSTSRPSSRLRAPSTETFTPHNDYVIYTYVSVPPEQEATAAGLATSAIDKQIPLIDKFPATPQDKLASMPVDPDGVLRYTVPQEADQRTINDLAVYGPRGSAHRAVNPVTSLQQFADAGTTSSGKDLTTAYVNRDADGATSLYDAFIQERTDEGYKVTDPAPGVPDSTCMSTTTEITRIFTCVVHVGKYVGEISATEVTRANQLTAAQYLILKSVS